MIPAIEAKKLQQIFRQ